MGNAVNSQDYSTRYTRKYATFVLLAKEIVTHLNLIVSVVVEVENSIDLGFRGNSDILRICDSFSQSLAGIFLHLDVVEFPVKR